MRPGGGAAVPQFLSKVWALVEDPQTDELICWSADGQSFNVLDEESFAKRILPKHFKHNNMASFVRQLNSYGFHKVMQYDSGSAKQERHGSGKYQHPFFRKGHEELLTKIKRKVPLPRIENGKIDPEEIHKMLAIIHHVQGKQHVMDSMLESLKRENEALWKEVLDLKQKQIQHQQLCEANITLQGYNQSMGLLQKQPLMIDSTGDYNQQSDQELVDQGQKISAVGQEAEASVKLPSVALEEMNEEFKRTHLGYVQEWLKTCQGYVLLPPARASLPGLHSLRSICLQMFLEYTESVMLRYCCSTNFCMTGPSLDSLKKEVGRTDVASDFAWTSQAAIMSDPSDTSVSIVSRLGSSFSQCAGKIHSSDTDWILEHRRSYENQGHLESEQATDRSGLDTDLEDCSSACSDSGHVEKRRKVDHSGIQKTEQCFNQIHDDSMKLTKRILALEENSLQKLSEISSTLSALASYIMNTEKSQRLPQAQGDLTDS